jgi:predicted amidohydrolase
MENAMREITVAGIQFNPQIGLVRENRVRILSLIDEVAGQGTQLVVFPECALSGYVFEDIDEARQAAEPVPGPSTNAMVETCKQLGVYTIVGLLEESGDGIYNSAVLCGPEGLIGVYRKTHLPFLGVDKVTALGPDPYRVYETRIGRIGMIICYDMRFPEPARCLALQGADIVAIPTNWPTGADTSPDFVAQTRAVENRVYVVAINRAGTERGAAFIGKSQIIEPSGRRLAMAQTTDETIITATFDPTLARQKRLVISPGEFEIDTIGDRRPELYHRIIEDCIIPKLSCNHTEI